MQTNSVDPTLLPPCDPATIHLPLRPPPPPSSSSLEWTLDDVIAADNPHTYLTTRDVVAALFNDTPVLREDRLVPVWPTMRPESYDGYKLSYICYNHFTKRQHRADTVSTHPVWGNKIPWSMNGELHRRLFSVVGSPPTHLLGSSRGYSLLYSFATLDRYHHSSLDRIVTEILQTL